MWRGVCVFGAGSSRRSRQACTRKARKWICARCVRYACCDRSNLSPAYRVSSASRLESAECQSSFKNSRLLAFREKSKEISRRRESPDCHEIPWKSSEVNTRKCSHLHFTHAPPVIKYYLEFFLFLRQGICMISKKLKCDHFWMCINQSCLNYG